MTLSGGAARAGALASMLLLVCVPSLDAQFYDGLFDVQTPYGIASLELVRLPGGAVEGALRGFGGRDFAVEGREAIDEDGELTLEGMFVGEGMADFTLFAEDDGTLGLVLVPYDASGAPQTGSSAVFVVTRATADGAPAPAPPTPGAGAAVVSDAPLDARVVGVWATQVVMNSPAGSVATQMFMHFGPDGVMTDMGSRAVGGMPGVGLETGLEGGGEQAYWSARDGVLVVSADGRSWAPLARYEFSEGRLVLRYVQDGSIQIWSLQRR